MSLKPGEVLEASIWVTGDEPKELRDRFKTDVRKAIDDRCSSENVIRGPITWTEKAPGSERVPPVPEQIQGQRVRLLVAEAEVVDYAMIEPEGSFVANLEIKDLQRLRAITRRSYPDLSDMECDEIIEKIGPEAALATLRSYH